MLLDRWCYITTGTLKSEDDGINDATHAVATSEIEETKTVDGEEVKVDVTVYVQREKVEDPNAKIFRIGMTVEEVEAALNA